MNCDPRSDAPNLHDRLVHVESLVMHLQRDFEQLNSAFLEQQRLLEALSATVARLERRLTVAAEGPEERDLLSERPPHY